MTQYREGGEEELGVEGSRLLVDVLVIGDVPDDLLRSHQLLRVVVGDLKTWNTIT